MAELRSGTSAEEAIADRRSALRELVAPFDAVHILGQVTSSESRLDADIYRESEHSGLVYITEHLAAELVCRGGRAGESKLTPPIDGNVLGEVRRLIREAVHFEMYGRVDRAGGLRSPESAARCRAAMQHLIMRGPGWEWQEEEVLRGLFSPHHVATRLRDELGFDVADALACVHAVRELLADQHVDHIRAAVASSDSFGPGNEAYEWASEFLLGWQDAPEIEAVKAKALATFWSMNHIGDIRDIHGEGVADYIELSPAELMVTVPGNDMWALRRILETALKTSQPYRAHRGQWLEREATRRLVEAVKPDEWHQNVAYEYTSEDGTRNEGEIDGLLRLGDTVLLVEAKGAALKPGARRGGQALIDHVHKHVTKAATQGERALEAIRRGDCLSEAGAPLQLAELVREVHPIAVTLDDLSSVAPVIWEFADTRTMPAGVTIPWLVTLFELEHVCATVEWPAQLVHFLRRRARLNALGGISATDELDWWMNYLTEGLYFEDDERPIRLASYTDPLDEWVLFERGMRERPARKPAQHVDRATRAILDTLECERPEGWVAAACLLLEPAQSVRKAFSKDVRAGRRRAGKRGKAQRTTRVFDETPDPMILIGVVVPDAQAEHLERYVEMAVIERSEEHGFHRTLALGYIESSGRAYDTVAVLERKWRSGSIGEDVDAFPATLVDPFDD